MKDYYDIWVLSQSFEFDHERLARAIAATFARRKTTVPGGLPDALTPAFADLSVKQQQWEAFKRDVAIDPGALSDVLSQLETFLMPAAKAARKGVQ